MTWKDWSTKDKMRAYNVHQHENVVFDGWCAVIGDHRLVDDYQRLDESLAADRPRCTSPPRRPLTYRRRPAAPIWSPPLDDRRRPPFVLIVSGRGPDGGRSSVIADVARVRRVPTTVVVYTRAEPMMRRTQHMYILLVCETNFTFKFLCASF